jgi:hypothetical protein
LLECYCCCVFLLLIIYFISLHTVAEFPGNVEKLHRASLTEVNQFVIAKYKEFTASDIGAPRGPKPQRNIAYTSGLLLSAALLCYDSYQLGSATAAAAAQEANVMQGMRC